MCPPDTFHAHQAARTHLSHSAHFHQIKQEHTAFLEMQITRFLINCGGMTCLAYFALLSNKQNKNKNKTIEEKYQMNSSWIPYMRTVKQYSLVRYWNPESTIL